MRQKNRRFLILILLAVYTGIALVGDGLHSLLPDGDDHHHHGLYVVGHSCGDRHHADHDHHAVCFGSPGSDELIASNSAGDSHVCEICSFLYQAISQPAEVAVPIDWQPLIVMMHVNSQPIYSPASLGPNAPRGPPLFLS